MNIKQFLPIMLLLSLNVLNAGGDAAPDKRTLEDALTDMSEEQLQLVVKQWSSDPNDSRSTFNLSKQNIEKLTPAPGSDPLKEMFEAAQVLDFSDNEITGEISAGTFEGLKNPQVVRLDGNKITRIAPDAFKANNSLQWVLFGNNPDMDDVTFKDLTGLWGIVGTARSVDLQNVRMLHQVKLDGLTDLTTGMFGKKIRLKHDWCKNMTIDLSGCDIKKVEEGVFEEGILRESTTVKVTRNKIHPAALAVLEKQLKTAAVDGGEVKLEVS